MKKILVVLGIIVVFLSIVVIYKYSSYESNIYINEVEEENNLSFMIETEYNTGSYEESTSSTWPSGYKYNEELSYCENGSNIVWNNLDRTITYSGGIADKCYIYFDKVTITEYLEILAETDTTNMTYDDYGNLRYIGANPNNYIDIGDSSSLWRIIGTFEMTLEDGTTTTLVKVIRNENLGTFSWDSSDSTTNSGEGVNEWSQADIMTELNTLYLNSESGSCYAGINNQTKTCDFTSNGLLEIQDKIASVVWNTGAIRLILYTMKEFYVMERGTATGRFCTSGDNCNDIIERTTSWTGKIGLMYPSDYGYSTSGGSTGRETCLTISSYDWINYSDCYENAWMLYAGSTSDTLGTILQEWTITSFASEYSLSNVIFNNKGYIYSDILIYAYIVLNIRPTLYLISTTSISSGNGTSSNPFKIN